MDDPNADMFQLLAQMEKENAVLQAQAPPDPILAEPDPILAENVTLSPPFQAQMDEIEAYVHSLAKHNLEPEQTLKKIEAFVQGVAQRN